MLGLCLWDDRWVNYSNVKLHCQWWRKVLMIHKIPEPQFTAHFRVFIVSIVHHSEASGSHCQLICPTVTVTSTQRLEKSFKEIQHLTNTRTSQLTLNEFKSRRTDSVLLSHSTTGGFISICCTFMQSCDLCTHSHIPTVITLSCQFSAATTSQCNVWINPRNPTSECFCSFLQNPDCLAPSPRL